MTRSENPHLSARLELIYRGASVAVILAGCSAFAGWMFDVAALKSVMPGLATMKVNTALAFVMAGVSLWLSQSSKADRPHSCAVAKGCAVLVAVIGLLTLTEYLMDYDLGIDQLLAMDRANPGTSYPGRMSLVTAFNFFFLGAALVLLDVEVGRRHYPSEWLSITAGFVSLVALIGYAYDVEALYSIGPYSSVALHTAAAFFLLSLGILCARGNRGWLSLIAGLRFGLVPQVITLVVAAVVLVGGLISAVMVRQSQSALREQITTNNLADADLVAQFAWRYMQAAQSSLEFLAKSAQVLHAVSSGEFAQATPNLQAFRSVNEWLTGSSLYDINGINRATGNDSTTSNVGGDYRDREWFQRVMSTGKSYLGLPVITREAKRAVVPYAVPVRGQKGEMLGVLAGGISLEALADSITKFQFGPGTRTSLSDRRQGGIILAHPDRTRILQPISGKNAATARLLRGERGTLETQSSSGEFSLTSFAPVPNLPWGVLILQPSKAAFAPVAASARRSLVLIGVLLILIGTGSAWLGRRVTHPLSSLREAANRFAAGDLRTRLNLNRQDELGDLSRAFDQMAAALSERTAQLEQVNDALQEQNREVQQANRLKSEFLANMSHELRTPLNAIIGFAQLMHDGKVGPIAGNHQEYLGDILGSARHLLQLINDVLDLAKVESGKMEFRPEPVSLPKIIGEVRQVLQALSASKRLVVEVEVSPAVERSIIDPAKLKQVLYNYLSNAIKFTPEAGRITVRALAEGDDRFRLEVEDTGIGIEEKEIGKLFVEFQQLEAGTTKKHQGTGLGLALTKKIVEAQGGHVGVRSAAGQGSIFYAVLPRIAEQKKEVAAPVQLSASPAKDGSTVLVIEDDEKDRRWLTHILEEAGYSVDSATTGAEGIAKAQANAYSGVLLDLILPDMGGWEVLHSVRANGPNKLAPVIVVTVVAEKGIAKGFPVQDFLVKPIEPQTLLDSLTKAGVSPKGNKKKILVVDDDPNTLKMAKATLDSSGYVAVCHSSGKEGLDAAAKSEFCAVVLDLLMPEIDGFEFLDRLRAIPNHRNTPVIVWTNKDVTAKDRERLKHAAQAIALKGSDGVSAVLRELERYVAPITEQSSSDREGTMTFHKEVNYRQLATSGRSGER